MNISDILTPQAVIHGLQAASKKKLLSELASVAAGLSGLDAASVFETLWEREKLGSTGVGQGIAIPHGRIQKLEKITGVFAQLAEPVGFDAIDDAPVDLVFLLLTPQDAGADHLKALARVSRLLRNPAMCEKLRAAKDSVALYTLLIEVPAGTQAA
jgi:PTS system nitrogen regulatory IIA component